MRGRDRSINSHRDLFNFPKMLAQTSFPNWLRRGGNVLNWIPSLKRDQILIFMKLINTTPLDL